MKGMTGERAIRVLKWAENWLKQSSPDKLTVFERELLAKCDEVEIAIPGYGRVPAIEVKDIIAGMTLVLEDGTMWTVDTIHKVDNALFELALNGKATGRQVIRKRYSTRIGYLKEQHATD